MDLATGRSTLVEEARELLRGMEEALLELESEGPSDERINSIFRAAHTIKGSAGLFGLTLIERFTQRLENVLDLVRAGKFGVDAQLATLLLRARDYIGQLVDAIEAMREAVDPDPALREELLAALERYVAPPPPAASVRATTTSERSAYHLSLGFDADFLAQGLCPSTFIEHLASLGELLYVVTCSDEMPTREQFEPQRLYVRFEIGLATMRPRADVEGVFAIAQGSCQLQVYGPGSRASRLAQMLQTVPQKQQRLGELLLRVGAVSQRDLADALASQAATPSSEPRPKLGEVLMQKTLLPAPVVQVAVAKQRQIEERHVSLQRIVKVDASRLDQLIDLVGELVIASEGARSSAGIRMKPEDIVEAMSKVPELVEQIRDRALTMRMTPIGDVFQRFPRVVRDASGLLGKQIKLEISGAEAELDKSMVERLADPLLHIVRNAIDHGIERVDERVRAGKPEQGLLRLHAHHESGCIVVEIADDGRGLDPAKLRKTAIARGVISADAELSQLECQHLIFLPGFTTAEKVTELSGRGVGMDVVKRNLESLRADIEIDSRVGVGTTFRLRLPLTLAIIDGFHTEVAGTTFVIPLELVEECVDIRDAADGGGQRLVNLREDPLPYLRLRDVFKLDGKPSARESLVVVSYGAQRVGLVVDRLLGNAQAVIKPLGQIFRGLYGVSSATILGDGSVALILDVPALIAGASDMPTPRGMGDLGAGSIMEEAQ